MHTYALQHISLHSVVQYLRGMHTNYNPWYTLYTTISASPRIYEMCLISVLLYQDKKTAVRTWQPLPEESARVGLLYSYCAYTTTVSRRVAHIKKQGAHGAAVVAPPATAVDLPTRGQLFSRENYNRYRSISLWPAV